MPCYFRMEIFVLLKWAGCPQEIFFLRNLNFSLCNWSNSVQIVTERWSNSIVLMRTGVEIETREFVNALSEHAWCKCHHVTCVCAGSVEENQQFAESCQWDEVTSPAASRLRTLKKQLTMETKVKQGADNMIKTYTSGSVKVQNAVWQSVFNRRSTCVYHKQTDRWCQLVLAYLC